MNDPALDVKDMLDDTSAGAAIGTFATDLFVADEPATPDACVTVYSTGGYAPDPRGALGIEFPTVQVRTRGARGGYTAASAKALAVQAALHGDYGTTWNGARYLWIFAEQAPMYLGQDDNDRPIFTQNFRMARTAST